MKRQYVLPSCSLTLEGMVTDAAQGMSILANAECRFMGIDQRLSGGLAFFQALVETVSTYAQGLLSSMPQPTAPEKLVRLTPTDNRAYHTLTVAARPEVDPALQEQTTLTLSTVQLFDLTDAVDQFLGDAQILPELSVPVRSRPRRDVKSTEPVTERALPPLIGAGAFAAAAVGLFMLPIPEVPEFDPESLSRSDQPGLEAPASGLTDPPDGIDGAAEETGVAVNNQLDLSAAELTALRSQLIDQITEALSADDDFEGSFDETLSYAVFVAENGDIVGYEAADTEAEAAVDETPLPALTYAPIEDGDIGATAQFSVQFEPDGSLDVEPLIAPSTQIVTDDPASGVESETDEDLSE